MVGKLVLFVAPTLIANLLNITLSNFEIKAEHCCNRRGTNRHTKFALCARPCEGATCAICLTVCTSST